MLRLPTLLYTCLALIACSPEQDLETNTPDNNSQKSELTVECLPEDCGPEISITCDEGTVLVSAPVCEANAAGTCEWSSGECSDQAPTGDTDTDAPDVDDCIPEDCGPQIAISCEAGSRLTHESICEANADGVCEWNIGECVEDEAEEDDTSSACQPEDCGPEIAISCEAGYRLTHESICEASADGVCEWNIGECVEDETEEEGTSSACQPEDCGPQISISCEEGYRPTHEPICEAGADGACGWTVGDCVELSE